MHLCGSRLSQKGLTNQTEKDINTLIPENPFNDGVHVIPQKQEAFLFDILVGLFLCTVALLGYHNAALTIRSQSGSGSGSTLLSDWSGVVGGQLPKHHDNKKKGWVNTPFVGELPALYFMNPSHTIPYCVTSKIAQFEAFPAKSLQHHPSVTVVNTFTTVTEVRHCWTVC